MIDGADKIVLDCVARCRARMRIVAAVRRAAVTIPIALVAVEAAAFATGLAPARFAAAAGIAVAFAAIAAAVPSILRPPSLRAAAASVDARLRLRARVVTAVQLLDDGDPMARLVVRDAAAHVATLSPARVFPLEAPSHFRAMVGIVLGTTAAFLVAVTFLGPSAVSNPSEARSIDAAAGGAARPNRSARPSSNPPAADAATSTSPRPPEGVSQTPANREDAPTARETSNDPRAPTLARGGNVSRTSESRSATAVHDRGSAGAGRDSGRGAAALAARTAAEAGGVSGTANASPSDGTRREPATAPGGQTYREQYRLASARAQSAVGQERIPVRLRAYVKRYFVAIHP